MAGEQARKGGRAAGGGVAQVDRAEPVLLVPVEREGAQGLVQVRCHSQQVRHPGLPRGGQHAGRTTGAFQGAYGGLGAEGGHETALVAGEFGEAVQSSGETVRLGRGTGRPSRPGVRVGGRGVRRGPRVRRAEDGGEFAVVLGEAPARAPAVHHPVVLGRPQRRGAHPSDLGRQRHPAAVLLGLAAAERVDVELVVPEPAHETVAPESGVTAHIRITTLRKQSDAHECTPDLPYGEPPLARRLAAGRT